MPTYEYRCPKGHRFEKFYPRINDRRHVPCPTCGARAERVISGGAGLVFKGSGFYVTDYKRSGDKAKQEGEPKSPESKAPASDSAKKKNAGDK